MQDSGMQSSNAGEKEAIKAKPGQVSSQSLPDSRRNKRAKHTEEGTSSETQIGHQPNSEQQKKILMQALAFEKELQDVRRIRLQFAKTGLKKAMERQAIGTSGYGRFLCSHYNPGSSFISSLNSIAQKYETKLKQKKRTQKGAQKKEEEKKENEENQNKTEKDAQGEAKIDDKKEDGKVSKDSKEEAKSKNSKDSGKEESKKAKEEKSKDSKPKSDKGIANSKEGKDSKTITSSPDNKTHPNIKPSSKQRPKEDSKSSKSKSSKSKPLAPKNTDKTIEKVTEELKDEVNIDELTKVVSSSNHNIMVDDILNQNNTRISNRGKKGSSTKTTPKVSRKKDSKTEKKDGEAKGPKVKREEKGEGKLEEVKNEVGVKKVVQGHTGAEQGKMQKVKEPKMKKVKPPPKKKVVTKMKPNKEKYKGNVVKKKFAPKKIGAPVAPKPEDDEDVQVVA